MAYLRDEATRVAPHGAPGVRVLRDHLKAVDAGEIPPDGDA